MKFTNLNNGVINCSLEDDGVPSYEDTCSFTCNTGYELTGSDTRTCQSDESWSGSDATCERGVCVYSYQLLRSASYGFIIHVDTNYHSLGKIRHEKIFVKRHIRRKLNT